MRTANTVASNKQRELDPEGRSVRRLGHRGDLVQNQETRRGTPRPSPGTTQ